MKKLLLVLFFYTLTVSSCSSSRSEEIKEQSSVVKPADRLGIELTDFKNLIKDSKYNSQYALLIDMQIPETKFRFFLIDLKSDSILHRGLVTHGHCGSYALGGPKFSNEVGSNCSSLGNFSIGKKYKGKFGTAYKLHGLDSTNSAAYERFIVLHAHSCIPEEETSLYLCQSQGCPTISHQMLKIIQPYIDDSSEPMLLRIFH